MTPPIPDVAVEAAARALSPNPAHWRQFMGNARTALTAALPLIEAEIRGQVAADCRVEAENVDLEVPNAYREGTRDGYLSAATIAERTNDEPVGR